MKKEEPKPTDPNSLLQVYQPLKELRFQLTTTGKIPHKEGIRVMANLKNKEVAHDELILNQVRIVADDIIEVHIGFKNLYLGPDHITGDLRVEIFTEAKLLATFEPPISNVFHPEGVTPELPSRGGEPEISSGIGRTRERGTPNDLTTITTVPVPQITEEPGDDGGDDPRDTPPPEIYGEELSPPAIPPFMGACEDPMVVEEVETTTSETSFAVGDPVYVHNGEFVRNEQDFYVGGIGPAIRLVRTYRSRVQGQSIIGHGWSINWEKTLIDLSAFGGSGYLYKNGFGRTDSFNANGQPNTPGYYAEVSQNSAGSNELLQADGGKLVFDSAGQYREIKDRMGNGLDFNYNNNGQLISVQDGAYKVVKLSYNSDGLLSNLVDWTGREIIYGYYDGNEMGGSRYDLKSVTATSRNLTNYPAGITTVYTYDYNSIDPNQIHNLISITRPLALNSLAIDPMQPFSLNHVNDLRDKADVFNQYDQKNRVLKQRFGKGMYYFEYLANGTETIVTDRAIETGMSEGQKTYFKYLGNQPLALEQINGLGHAILKLEHNDTAFSESTAYVMPSGKRVEFTYDRLNPNPKRRGDLLTIEWFGSQPDQWIKSSQTLNEQGQVLSIVEPRGYEPGADPNRYTTSIFYDTKGNPTLIVFPPISHYDGRGQIINSSPRPRQYANYNTKGQLTKMIEVDGVVKEYIYYPAGDSREGLLKMTKLTAVDGSKSLEVLFELDDLGRPVQVTQTNGAVTTATYDVFNQIVSTKDPIGADRNYAYDQNGNLLEVKLQNLEPDGQGAYRQGSPEWFVESAVYDDYDRIITIIRGSSDLLDATNTNKFTYDGADRLVTLSSDAGTVTRHDYGPRSLVSRTIFAEGTVDESEVRVINNMNGQISKIIDAEGHIATHHYDWLGRLIAIDDPLAAGASQGPSTYLEYDASSHVIRTYRLDRNGIVIKDIRRTYDERGHLAFEEDQLAGTLALITYNDISKNIRTAVYDQTSYTVLKEIRRVFNLNHFGEAIWAVDGEGNKIEYFYDQFLRLASVERIGSNGQFKISTEYTYDIKNRVLGVEVVSGDGQIRRSSSILLDSRNLMTASVDAKGQVVEMRYNGLGQLVALDRFVHPSAIQHETFTYTKDGYLEKLTDGGGNFTLFEYNRKGARTKATAYDGSVAHFIHKTDFDKRGLPISVLDGRGNQVTNQFDEMGRLIQRDILLAPGVGGPTFERFTYDDMNQLLRAENDFSSFSQSFNVQGLIESELQAFQIGSQSGTKSIRREFNLAGDQTEIEYPGGRILKYDYDMVGHPTSVREGSFQIAKFNYLAPNMFFRKVYGNGTQTTCIYDGLANMKTVHSDGPGGQMHPAYNYQYDSLGNVLSEIETSKNLEDAYHYDALNQLTSVELSKNLISGTSGTLIHYEYDWAGNFFKVERASQATLYSSNGINQYTAVGPQGQQKPFIWDKDFNLTESPGRKLYYDYGRCLIKAEVGQRVFEFTYDAVRRLIHKSISEPGQVTKETHYYYDDDRVIETEGDNAATYVYGEGLDELISYKYGGSDYYIHQKRLWHVSHITDDQGNVVEFYKYDPHGKRTVFDGQGNQIRETAVGNLIGFTGRWLEHELRLYYFRARWYDVELGRFTTPDPDGWVDGLNVYRYARNNPSTFFDPYGTTAAEFLSGIKDGFKEKFLGGFWDTLETMADIVMNIGDYVNTFKTMLKALTDPNAMKNVWGAVKEAVESELSDAWSMVEGAINALKGEASHFAGKQLGKALGFLASKLIRGGGSIALFFAKIGKKVKNLLKKAKCKVSRATGMGPGCFLDGTLVVLRDELKRIEDIKIGDEVLSCNEETGEEGYKKVVRLYRGHTSKVVNLEIIPHLTEQLNKEQGAAYNEQVAVRDKQIIRCTEGHPYWVADRGWEKALNLSEGDILVNPNGNESIVLNVNLCEEKAYHYNFEVADWHTYFVSDKYVENSLWVHNQQTCSVGGSSASGGSLSPDSPPAPITTKRGNVNTSTRKAIGGKKGDGDDARHMISDRSIRTMQETALGSQPTRGGQAYLLAMVGHPPKSLSDKDINRATRKWQQQMTNNQENLWMGDRSKNRSIGADRDFPPGTTPGNRK
ncbi:polymorphic toxin-type HINT domain-containing protein [Aquimarina intermedia]|uniref:RHS repeat-associated protein n=1 Tax=Aquimarina intermedia TaxID=350814 RepID=A0A5S5BXA7_9FLAO|nr:polymorphic toxin-type HINT domain-containing protein [Aquimarina intermedia]TYP71644.1 RHS repeat-associated protein [Aquimarina intermedia]